MSDYDRGAYTPPTDDLAFDARAPRQRRPMPITLLASGVVLLVMVGALIVFYQQGVRGANEPPRVVGESVASLKSPPIEEAKPIDESAGLQVYVDDPNGGQAAPTFAAAPEQPQPRPAPVVETATIPGQARSGVTVLEPAAPAPAAPVTVPARAEPRPAPPVRAEPVRAEAAPARPAAVSAASGTSAVQIGAFSSAAIANAEYAKVKSAFATWTAGRGKHVEPVEREGQTLYRTTFTGFAREDAQKFCAALKAAGRACIVR